MLSHPPIDPEIAAALAQPNVLPASMTPAEIPERRREADAIDHAVLARGGSIAISEITARGPRENPALPALLLRALSTAERRAHDVALAPGIVFIHGGGMVMGSRFNIGQTVLDAVAAGIRAVSIEYRLAPEHPYPAAVDDCHAAWGWVYEHADDLGIDRERLAILGSSAGGGIAAGVTLRLRDEGAPLPSHQVLFCPMLDDREITPSSTELDGVGRWDRTANRTGWAAYLGERCGHDDVPDYAAPARVTDLSGLPPTYLDVGDVETFRDEDIDYAARLARAGVSTEFHLWPGGVHGFTGMAPEAALSRRAAAARLGYLMRRLMG